MSGTVDLTLKWWSTFVTVSADLLNTRIDSILNEKNGASSSQMTQAERMVKISKLELTSGQVRDNVAVPIPLLDRGRSDTQSILGIIIDRDENDMYAICVKARILKEKFVPPAVSY